MAQSGTLLAACKRSVACLVVANSLFPILPRRSYRSCTHHSLTRRYPRSDISVAREINERITSKKRVDRNGVSGREREKLARTRKRSFTNEIGTSSRRRRERFTEYSLKREILLARGLEFGREGGRAIFGSALEQGKRLSRVSRTPPLLATEKPSRYRPELFDIWDEADRLLPNFFLPLPPVRKFPPERRQTRSPSLSSLHFFQKIASSTLRYIDGDVVSNALLLRYSFCSRLTYDLPYFLNTRMLRKRYIPISFAFFLSYDSRTLDFYGLNFDAYDTRLIVSN